MQRIVRSKLLKYLVSGAGAFTVEYVSFYCLYRITALHLLIANAVSFFLGLLTSFILNKLWTFDSKTHAHRTAKQFNMYVILALINLVATLLLVQFFSQIGFMPEIGKFFAMILTSVWNFFLFKKIIFKNTT